MARFAGDLVDLTFWQLRVGGAGIALLVVTLFITARATKAATNATKIARDEFIASHRPWIEVIPCFLGPLTWNDKGDGSVEINFTLTNTGSVPATNIDLTKRIIINDGLYNSVVDEQKKMSERVKARQSLGRISHIFPNGKEHSCWEIRIPAEQIEEHAAKAKAKGITVQIPQIYIVGYVRYINSSSGEEHQTGFIYLLKKNQLIGEFGVWIAPNEPVAKINLVLDPSPLGPGAIY